MKVVAVTICHYGVPYLWSAMKAVEKVVDEHLVFYTKNPSHGTKSSLPCPDTKEDIQKIVSQFSKGKMIEASGFILEGQQRDFAYKYAQSIHYADIIVIIDYDEIWDETVLKNVLSYITYHPENKKWLINFTTLFRSFGWVCHDEMWPLRFINFKSKREETGYVPTELGEIYHLGYAIPDKYMEYKWSLHGHIHEMKPDWMKKVWHGFPNSVKDGDVLEDVHPTCKNTWYPRKLDKHKLPVVLHEHPYFLIDKDECIV